MVKHLVPLGIGVLGGISAYFVFRKKSGLPIVPALKTASKAPAAAQSLVKAMASPNATIQKGSTGAAVLKLQLALGESQTGTFSDSLEFAVKEFQKSHGLAVDGVVGPQTWSALSL